DDVHGATEVDRRPGRHLGERGRLADARGADAGEDLPVRALEEARLHQDPIRETVAQPRTERAATRSRRARGTLRAVLGAGSFDAGAVEHGLRLLARAPAVRELVDQRLELTDLLLQVLLVCALRGTRRESFAVRALRASRGAFASVRRRRRRRAAPGGRR